MIIQVESIVELILKSKKKYIQGVDNKIKETTIHEVSQQLDGAVPTANVLM